jgi:hypothetical protein
MQQTSANYPLSPASAQGARAWIISDGKTGHLAITKGVADAMGLQYKIFPVAPRGLRRIFAPWAPVSPAKRPGAAASPFRPPWPKFVFAAGRTTIPYLRAIHWATGGESFTVAFQDPRIGARTADLIWAPLHDKLRGDNVINTITAPHGFSPDVLDRLAGSPPPEIAALPKPRIAVLIGGPSQAYGFTAADAAALQKLVASAVELGAGLMITASRRTPPDFIAKVEAAAQGAPAVIWRGLGENPYPSFLACADMFIVTADSVNMAGEAASTGKPIYIFHPTGGKSKFERFHHSLRALGVTRDAPEAFASLEMWTYAPIDAARIIACEITRRWVAKTRQAHATHAPNGRLARL